MRPGALPISQQVLLDLIVPPVGTGVWWLLARGWAKSVQGGSTSGETKARQRIEFCIVLGLAYLVMFSFTIYGWFTR